MEFPSSFAATPHDVSWYVTPGREVKYHSIVLPNHSRLKLLILAIGIFWGLSVPANAAVPGAPQCEVGQRECIIDAMRALPVKKAEYWKDMLGRPLPDRFAPAPQALVDFLALDDAANSYPNIPHLVPLTAEFIADVRQAFAELPEPVKRLIQVKLAGVYFLTDFGGSGFTDMVFNKENDPVAAFTVLDPAALTRTANQWATWKESSPFRPSKKYTLSSAIETPRNDNRKNAIQYILLHEFGHVISVGNTLHPPWNVSPSQFGSTAKYPFFNLSWQLSENREQIESRFDAKFPGRKNVVYYFGPKLDADQMVATYTDLEKTNFATLYSVTHYGDDFAEAFANYVHVVMMGKPFQITIEEDGKVVKTYGACWNEPRCAEKKKLLAELLKSGEASPTLTH